MRRLAAALLLLAPSPAASQQIDVSLANKADGSRSLVHEIVIRAPVTEVWAAVATTEGWRTWAVPMARRVPGTLDRFETSYATDAPPGGPSTIEQQWVTRAAPRQVVFRTTRTPQGFPHADSYRLVESSFVLTPTSATATRVRLTGSGYPTGSAGDALIAFFREGNRTALQQLHSRFTTGPIDWAARRVKPGQN